MHGGDEKYIQYKILVRKSQSKRSLWRPRHGREDNIKIKLKERSGKELKRIAVARDRVLWRTGEHGGEHLGSVKAVNFLARLINILSNMILHYVPLHFIRGVKLTTHLRLVPRSESECTCTSTPPMRLHGVVLG
jgi:hypothetical protein